MDKFEMTTIGEQELELSSIACCRHKGAAHRSREKGMTGKWKHIPEDVYNNDVYFRFGNSDKLLYVPNGQAENSKTIPMRKSDKFFFPKGSKGTRQPYTPFEYLFIQSNSPQKHDDLVKSIISDLKTTELITSLNQESSIA